MPLFIERYNVELLLNALYMYHSSLSLIFINRAFDDVCYYFCNFIDDINDTLLASYFIGSRETYYRLRRLTATHF